jgi:hypothetical protein
VSRRGSAALRDGLVALAATPAVAQATVRPRQARSRWVGTWAAVPTAAPPTAVAVLEDKTVRQVVRTSIGGSSLPCG